ncbi:hypothetical protein CP533_2184 [Ophiocordyceps camponoti-saundersi (nom. inval.)]|nr:hypothetical protein CP533_2184 [Ophiocordyceps camponoti-saundersi (nom. inval.)]
MPFSNAPQDHGKDVDGVGEMGGTGVVREVKATSVSEEEQQATAPTVPGDELHTAAHTVSGEEQQTTVPTLPGDERHTAAHTVSGEEQQETVPEVSGDEPPPTVPTIPEEEEQPTAPPVTDEERHMTVSEISGDEQSAKAPATQEEEKHMTVPAGMEEEQQARAPTISREGLSNSSSSIPLQQHQGDACAQETPQDLDMRSPSKHDTDEGSQQCPQEKIRLPDPATQTAGQIDEDGTRQADKDLHDANAATAEEPAATHISASQQEIERCKENGKSESAAEDVTMSEELRQEVYQVGALAEPEQADETVATSEHQIETRAADVPTGSAQVTDTKTEVEQHGNEDGDSASTEHAQAEITIGTTSKPPQEQLQTSHQDENPGDPMAVDAPESPPSLTNALLAALGGFEPAEEERTSNGEGLQNDEGENPEWEVDSDPYESSDSSSSDSESDDEAYELLGIDETMKLLMETEAGSDDEGGKGGKGPSATSARSKNELPDEVIPRPEVTVTPYMKIEELGLVEHVVEGNIVVKAVISGEYQVLDTGSVLCTADRVVIGAVAETLGKVLQPMYTVRFNSEEEIRQLGVEVGTRVFYPVDHASYVFTEPLRAVKGSDASNIHDEEVAADEMEFSDDEKEAEHKRAAKSRNRNRSRGTLHPHPHPLRQEMTSLDYDDVDVDGPYKPLSRPADFGTAMNAPPPPPRSQPQRRGRRGGGDGRGDRRGRGNRRRDQPREGFSLPPQAPQRQRTPPPQPINDNGPWNSGPAPAFSWPAPSPWPVHPTYSTPAPAPVPQLAPTSAPPGWPSQPPVQGQVQGNGGAYVNPALVAALIQLQARNGGQAPSQWQPPPGGWS